MNWLPLTSIEQLEEISILSNQAPQLIFKHSTRCSISIIAKNRLERSAAPENITFYYLDLLTYRNVSDYIADKFNIHHQSPQILLIKNGECIFEETHNAIDMDEIVSQAN
ncbi:MAG: bacillithiol system redox-active protein YtxJ [Bacteroidota bacterium]